MAQKGCSQRAMEACTAPVRIWARWTGAAEKLLSRGFRKVGEKCARHPWKCLGLSLILCLAFAAGVVQYKSESGSRALWVDQNSQQMKNLEPLGINCLGLICFFRMCCRMSL